MTGHQVDYMPTYLVPDLATFLVCVVLAVLNFRKARKCMRLLDLAPTSTNQGTIHHDSIAFHKVTYTSCSRALRTLTLNWWR